MNYQNRILCYFDILGFSDNVENKIKEANEINQLFEEIASIIEDYRDEERDIQISHFSDSFVISILKPQNAPTQLRFVVSILIKLLEYQLIARGVIVYGELIHTSKHIFGPALIKAVDLEKKDLFPRIIIDESLSNLIIPTIGNSHITYGDFFNDFAYVKTDIIGDKKYIDFIGEINKKEDNIEKNLIETIKNSLINMLITKNYLQNMNG